MKRLKLCVIALVISALGYLIYENYAMNKVQSGIAAKIVRFHIRANSDLAYDQELKLKVKAEVLTYIEQLLADAKSKQQVEALIVSHTEDIKKVTEEAIHRYGYNYEANVYYEETYFPLKAYGDVTFPPGIYDALCIDIGGGDGKNYWCVLYPKLCFVDLTCGVVPDSSKEELKDILTDREYEEITINSLSSGRVRYKLKCLEH